MSDITGILIRLAPLIEQKVRKEVYLHINLPKEVANLANTLKEVQMVLEEAERRRLTDPRVRSWLEKLGSVTYEIDDALDTFQTANLELLTEDDDPKTWLEQVGNFFQSFCSCLCFRHVLKRREIALAIRGLKNKVDELAKEKVKYDMLPISNEFSGYNVTKTEINTAFSEFIELEEQGEFAQSLIETVKSQCTRDNVCIPVLSLLGMAGTGKTTIARRVYFDEKFQQNFDRKMWICVSNCFDEIRVAKTILQLSGVPTFKSFSDFQALLEQIKSSISGKKIFLVLDDVWIKDDQKWKQIRASLSFAASGSGILVTTRNKNVAKLMGSFGDQFKEVFGISENDCRLILTRIAFIDRKINDELNDMGWSLAKRCERLPLAAETLGNHLQSINRNVLISEVLKKEFWESEEVANPIFASFAFSYYELPSEVRRCFAFCGTIPKDLLVKDMMSANELINLWAMQGYLSSSRTESDKSKISQSTDDMTKLKLRGQEYFDRLCDCHLLSSVPHIDGFMRMHGLLHDFARYLMKTSNSMEEGRSFFSRSNLPSGVVPHKSVRVLSLTGDKVTWIGEEIVNLIHLRLINLSRSSITRLPKSLCILYNLQSLDLTNCTQLRKFPEGFSKLRNLRQLFLGGTNILDKRGMAELTRLQTFGFDKYLVKSGSDLGVLKKLNQLRGYLSIHIEAQLTEEEDFKEASKATLKKKEHLTELHLSFKLEVSVFAVDALQPPPNLKTLRLESFNGTQFPIWINSSSLSKLQILQVRSCRSCITLPPLGTLPLLVELELRNLYALESISTDFLGLSAKDSRVETPPAGRIVFPRLKSLYIIECENLLVWNDISEEEMQFSMMPCLERLEIDNCQKLKGMPHRLIGKAVSLSKVKLNWPNLSFDKRGIEGLTGIQSLGEEYAVNSGKDLGRLEKLNILEGFLRIHIEAQLNGDEDVKEARKAKLEMKERLTDLHLIYGDKVSISVADALRPPPNMKTLKLMQFNDSTRLPTWINSSSLGKLKNLYIGLCRSCTSLPPLGMLSLLESLALESLFSVESIGIDLLGLTEDARIQNTPLHNIIFPRLRFLAIRDFPNLQFWDDISEEEDMNFSIMPCLEQLDLHHCPKLKALPHRLLGKAASLSKLHIKSSHYSRPYLVERYNKNTGKDYSVVAHIRVLEFSYGEPWRGQI